jgi:hypothetical protein
MRVRINYDLSEAERQCPWWAAPPKKIGEDVSARLKYVPASAEVPEGAQVRCACRGEGCV